MWRDQPEQAHPHDPQVSARAQMGSLVPMPDLQADNSCLYSDAVLPLSYPGCEWNEDGFCAYDTVLKGLIQRSEEIDYEYACYGNCAFSSPGPIQLWCLLALTVRLSVARRLGARVRDHLQRSRPEIEAPSFPVSRSFSLFTFPCSYLHTRIHMRMHDSTKAVARPGTATLFRLQLGFKTRSGRDCRHEIVPSRSRESSRHARDASRRGFPCVAPRAAPRVASGREWIAWLQRKGRENEVGMQSMATIQVQEGSQLSVRRRADSYALREPAQVAASGGCGKEFDGQFRHLVFAGSRKDGAWERSSHSDCAREGNRVSIMSGGA